MTETTPRIYSALSAVMESVGSIAKTQTNKFDGYKFRGIDDVFNALHPALLKAGVVVLPCVEKCERHTLSTAKGGEHQLVEVVVEYQFVARDGSSVSVRVAGEGSDRGDKAVNKAMSSAYKTAMFQVFCIPVEGDSGAVDSESDSPDLTPAKLPPHLADNPFGPSEPKPAPVPAGTTKLPEETVKAVFSDAAEVAGDYVYPAGSQPPDEPKWKKWREDKLQGGKMKGRTWGEIAEGSYGGQRYQWARSIMTWNEAKPDTQLRAANCVYEIETRAQAASPEEF